MQAGLFDAPYVHGSETSEAAAASLSMWALTGLRLRVYRALLARGEGGATCDELEVELGMLHQTCSARVLELRRMGVVKVVGQRPTRTQRMAGVYVAEQPEESE